jgi:hypothetical protein
MNDQEIIDHLSHASCMVHVRNPLAYEAFAQGKVIFDLSRDGEGIQAFIETFILKLTPEFGADIVRRGPDSLPNFPGVSIHTLYHRHKAIENAMPELGRLENQER